MDETHDSNGRSSICGSDRAECRPVVRPDCPPLRDRPMGPRPVNGPVIASIAPAEGPAPGRRRRVGRAGVLGRPAQRPLGRLVLRPVGAGRPGGRGRPRPGGARHGPALPDVDLGPVRIVPPRPGNDLRGPATPTPTSPSVSAGIHLEGPYVSSVDGYRGAHPFDAVRDPDWDEFRRFQDAAEGRIVLMTLAPERPGALDFIAKAVASGVDDRAGPHRRRRPHPPRRRRRRRDPQHPPRQRDRLAPPPPPEPDLGTGRARLPAAPRSSPTATTSTARPSRSSSAPRRSPGRSSSATPAPSPASPRGRTARGRSTPRARSSSPGRRISPARIRGSKSA